MFTLKVFHLEGGYTAIACKSYCVGPPDPEQGNAIWISTEPLTGTAGEEIEVEDKVIVENANGKTIDVIRARAVGNG